MGTINKEKTDQNKIIQRVQNGDRQAFETLYHQHVGRIYSICLRMVANDLYAEELTQEVFVRTWDRIQSFRGDGSFDGWLQRLAVNTVLTDLRMQKRRRNHTFTTDNLGRYERDNPAPSPGMRLDLEAAIAGLPSRARLIFVLYDIEGFRHDEIARQLGIAVGTSKTQLHRARKLLREALQK